MEPCRRGGKARLTCFGRFSGRFSRWDLESGDETASFRPPQIDLMRFPDAGAKAASGITAARRSDARAGGCGNRLPSDGHGRHLCSVMAQPADSPASRLDAVTFGRGREVGRRETGVLRRQFDRHRHRPPIAAVTDRWLDRPGAPRGPMALFDPEGVTEEKAHATRTAEQQQENARQKP